MKRILLRLLSLEMYNLSRTATALPRNFRRPSTKHMSSLRANAKPSVAIVGSGAVGGYYGARLWESNAYDVKFQMRGSNFSESTKKGLQVTSLRGDIFIPPEELQAFTDTRDIGKVDWVIVAVKSSSLDAIPALISPLLKPGKTRVLAIMNGMIEADLIQLLKDHEGEDADNKHLHCCGVLYGGMSLNGSNRTGPGVINHFYAGKLHGGVAAFHPSTTAEESLVAYEDFWRPVTKVETALEASILSGRWRKSLCNLPINGLSVAMGGITVDKIVNDPELRKLVHLIMDETIATANLDILRHGFDKTFFLGDDDRKTTMDLFDNLGPYRTSSMIDFVDRNPMEVRYLFRKPVDKANELGIDVPHLEALVTKIEALQELYDLY